MTLQFGASLTDDTRSVNYDRNTFIIQATAHLACSSVNIDSAIDQFIISLFSVISVNGDGKGKILNIAVTYSSLLFNEIVILSSF